MYLAVYSFFSLLGLGVRHSRSTPWLIASLLFLLWFMGARYYVGCDFTGYLNRFENLPTYFDLTEALTSAEPGFQILITAVRGSGLDYMWLNMAASAIMLAGYFVFLRAQFNPLMILALLFPIVIMQLSMSGIRQGIAVALLLVASVHFMRGQRLMTGLWILLGAQFHTSILVFLPIAALAGRKVSAARLVGGTMILGPAVVLLLADRLGVYQDRYVDQIYGDMSSGGAFIRYGLSLVPALLFFVYRRAIKAAAPDHYELLKLFSLITIALLPAGLISTVILHRLNYFVMPFSIVTLVILSHRVLAKGNNVLVKLLPVLAYGGYTLGWQLTSRHANLCYLPYENYLFIGG